MNKKGLEMATGTIIAIVLGLIVLIILVIFIQSKVSESGKKIGTLESEADYAPDKCQSLIKGTFCASQCDPNKYATEATAPTGKAWTDCEKMQGKPVCCVPKSS